MKAALACVPKMHKKLPVCESCGQCFLMLTSDQMFVVFVPVFDRQTLKIALLFAFIVEPAESKIFIAFG